MKITIVAVGTRGDVQPLLALGLGLKARGIDVNVVTHSNFHTLVDSLDLKYSPISLDMEAVLHTEEGKEWLTAGRNIWKTVTQMTKLWKLHFDSMFPEIREGCEGADAILFSYLGMGAAHIAEKHNIPCIGTWPTPVSVYPTKTMALSIPLRWAHMFGGKFAVGAHYATEQMVWQTFGRAQNKWRENLGLLPIRFPGIISHFRKRRIPFLYGFSPQIVPPPPSWPDWIRVSGYWLLESNIHWEPPQDLADFVEKESKPFYIGFGSMVTMAPERLADIAFGALKLLNARGVISTGWTGLKASELNKTLPANILAVDYVPHNWLFPRVRGLVHHGGASTTGAALLSGKPSLIVPFFADQAYWGDRLEHLGVAAKSIPFKKLTSMKLAEGLNDLQSKESLHSSALAIASKLLKEDGVGNAVNSILEFVQA